MTRIPVLRVLAYEAAASGDPLPALAAEAEQLRLDREATTTDLPGVPTNLPRSRDRERPPPRSRARLGEGAVATRFGQRSPKVASCGDRCSNRRTEAREQLRAAHALFVAMNAEAFADRARRELLATGETVRRQSIDGLAELTPQEAQIARLASEFRTNPEIGAQLFLSPRTVEWHLRNVFAKLGVSSRRELRAALPR